VFQCGRRQGNASEMRLVALAYGLVIAFGIAAAFVVGVTA
jgi:hypothetical protein